MTTLYPFTPSSLSTPPFSFTPTLDGTQYAAAAKWNVYGQRWYLELSTLTGTVVFLQAIVGSPNPVNTALISVASPANPSLIVQVADPTGLYPGQTVTSALVPVGTKIGAVRGYSVLLVLPSVLDQAPLAIGKGTDPNALFGYDTNMAYGYFKSSTLVFRESSGNFEVNP